MQKPNKLEHLGTVSQVHKTIIAVKSEFLYFQMTFIFFFAFFYSNF